jgi:uncharacterized protein (TIGR02246 family)
MRGLYLICLLALGSLGVAYAHPQKSNLEAPDTEQPFERDALNPSALELFEDLDLLLKDEFAKAYQVDIDALDQLSQNWRAAYEEGDFAVMEDLYEVDAWLMTRHQPARKGRDNIISYFKAARLSGAKAQIKFEPEQIEFDGDYAFKTAYWWLSVPRANGTTLEDSGRSFVVFRRGFDKKWRIWRDMDNNTPDVPPVTPETFK